ncbi:unnamed protein product, partial [Ectocarpus sp. 12 AP-2014]
QVLVLQHQHAAHCSLCSQRIDARPRSPKPADYGLCSELSLAVLGTVWLSWPCCESYQRACSRFDHHNGHVHALFGALVEFLLQFPPPGTLAVQGQPEIKNQNTKFGHNILLTRSTDCTIIRVHGIEPNMFHNSYQAKPQPKFDRCGMIVTPMSKGTNRCGRKFDQSHGHKSKGINMPLPIR